MLRTGATSALALLLLVAPATTAGADLKDDLNRVTGQMEELRSQVGGVREERTVLANAILDTGARLETLSAELASAEARLAETEAAIGILEDHTTELKASVARRQSRIDRLRVDIGESKTAARDRAVELYMAGEDDASMSVFTGDDVAAISVGIVYAERVQEVADEAVGNLQSLQEQEGREIVRLEAEQAELEVEIAALEVQEAERAAVASEVQSRTDEVAAELAVQEAQLAELQHEIAHIEGEIRALEAEEDEIKALIREEQGGSGSFTGGSGTFFRPVPGGVSSGFGYRIHPIYGTRRLHTGWDMNAGCGEPIYAAEAGRIIYSGWRGGYGNAIIIDHGGGIATLYGHQSRVGAGYGASVVRGEVIGWIGTTGVSTGCHLHFEVRRNGTPVDPTPWL